MRQPTRIIRLFIIIAACGIACAAASCSARTGVGSPAGIPARTTPYDHKFEKVRKYLERVHDNTRYVPERGDQDYWQLPDETETLGSGDCEDMAIWLYVLLKQAGFGAVRLCIGKHRPYSDQMHAWVMWFDGPRLYILDPSVTRKPLRASDADPGSYVPRYSYDGSRRWIHLKPAS